MICLIFVISTVISLLLIFPSFKTLYRFSTAVSVPLNALKGAGIVGNFQPRPSMKVSKLLWLLIAFFNGLTAEETEASIEGILSPISGYFNGVFNRIEIFLYVQFPKLGCVQIVYQVIHGYKIETQGIGIDSCVPSAISHQRVE